MSLTYSTSAILFALKILPFQHDLLLWSPSHKSRYGHSVDNVWENVSSYGLGLTVFVLSKSYYACFFVFSSSTKFCHGATTIVLLSTNSTFYQIYHDSRITVKVFLYFTNFVSLFTFKSTCIFSCNYIIDKEVFFHRMVRICLPY